MFKDGEIGKRWVGALEAAAKRGVKVRVVLDSIGATMAKETEERLKAAGIEVLWFNPLRFYQLEETNYRTHRKVLVVDGEVAFIGGMGVDDQWTGHAQDKDHWRDTQFKVVGPAVRALEASFYENWLESGGQSAPALDPERPPSRAAPGPWWSGAMPPAARATSSCCICSPSPAPGRPSTSTHRT